MKIPVNQIKFGIQHCLYSSRNICNIAKIIFTQYQTELGNGGTSIIPKYSVIMLYYAIEELGKAIMLEEKLDDVKNKNLTEITDNVNIFRNHNVNIFRNHNIKIDKAQEKYPDLFIEKFKKKITKEYLSEFRSPETGRVYSMPTSEFELIPDGDTFPTFMDRSNLWLVTFDELNNKWLEPIDDFDIEKLSETINQLDLILSDWQTKYD